MDNWTLRVFIVSDQPVTRFDFPTRSAYQASRAGDRDVFVAKFDPLAGGDASLLYSTYLGGSENDRGLALALSGADQVFVTGLTQSTDFPVASAYDSTFAGGTCGTRSCYDAFVFHLDLSANSLVYSTYLGGTSDEEGRAIAASTSGHAYVTGYTKSTDFPVLEAIQATKGVESCAAPPCEDAFLTKLDASGSALVYSTYLGGSGDDQGNGIALDGSGGVYLAGEGNSSDFPVTPGAYDTTLNGTKDDVFIVKISEPSEPPPPSGMSPTYNCHYAYDNLSRLTYACSDWDAGTSTCVGDGFNYSYDGAGNLLAFSRWDEAGAQVETVNFVYNGANQIACLDGGANGACGDPDDVAYSYDAYGNLTGDGARTYAYDAENRLVSVSDGTSTTSYIYSGDGDRVSQTVDGVATSYVIDIATPLTMVLAETTGPETIYYLQGLDLVAQNDGTSTEYFGYDGLGSVRQMLGSSGSVLFAQVFDPYGNPYASAGTDSTRFGFAGEQEAGAGLIFLRARYYDPRAGRFLQIDPSRFEPNLYVYAQSNPVNRIDPTGLQSNCAKGTCGPDVTEWLMKEMKNHFQYGSDVQSMRAKMKLEAFTLLPPISTAPPMPLVLFARQSPFNEIVRQFTFPKTNIPIGYTFITALNSAPVIDALGILEFALYGLAVDYSNVTYNSPGTSCGTSGCGDFNGHPSVTLCDYCIDASDIGNMMFGVGGAARAYNLGFTYLSAVSELKSRLGLWD